MKTRKFIIFFSVFILCINVHVASAQSWRDPLNMDNVVGIRQFHLILMPVAFLSSLLLTDSNHDLKREIGAIRSGSWFMHSRVAYYKGYKSAGTTTRKTDLFQWNMGFGHYFRKWLAAGIDFQATGFIDTDIKTFGVGGGPFVRWHLISCRRWSLYFEQGAGIIFIKSEFPPHGTKMNFTPTYGLGMSLKLFPHIYFMVSIRQYHISNAGLMGGQDRNPGFDSNGIYIGSQFQF